ncbi:hypothetical protein K3L72_19440 [Bacillus altitudinis]|uniref:Uncharacterized protein n=1 Tax=Bacillus pumilus TaxID=1408 RepID=A0A0C5BKB1_BACPU|nr:MULTISPECIES: hypothetical protein [Bacillus]AJM87313.1 hypothetical protein 6 [Bacillus pumilus]MBY0188329.1 hypothetical protein [Bacillus aerophilus]CUB18447.1 hypothetical protein BN2127_JRS3_01528 [Bacillus safensis]KLK98442.1 hypothetical protein XJ18_15665 [Bacillus pumilus]MCW4359946.1 hypothetical protein [Bacillus altitudinis]
MSETIINLIASIIAVLLIVFVLSHKKLEKKLDLTILILVATTIFLVKIQWIWITVFLLSFVYFGIKYTYKSKKG